MTSSYSHRGRARGAAGPAEHIDEPVGSRKCAAACATALRRTPLAHRAEAFAILAASATGLAGGAEAFRATAPATRLQ